MENIPNLPTYKSHKKVRAAKIKHLKVDPDDPKSGAMIVPVDGSIGDIPVNQAYIDKHKPQSGGYFVMYEDGYCSFSPSEAFEGGYSKM